jgi:NAD(P)-dependent dehydrogenase (short-subunit alcohol dehydrogenase family)
MAAKSESEDLPSFRLNAPFAIFTGASEGIGRTLALAFARSGAEVALISRSREKLQGVERAITKAGGRPYVAPADLSRFGEIRSVGDQVSELASRTSNSLILVNYAGFSFTKNAFDITEEVWDKVLDLHVKGTFFARRWSAA